MEFYSVVSDCIRSIVRWLWCTLERKQSDGEDSHFTCGASLRFPQCKPARKLFRACITACRAGGSSGFASIVVTDFDLPF